MPPSLHDWLAENHLAHFIGEIVGELDLKPIRETYWRKDSRGAGGYRPELLVRLLLYGYATGLTSSRRIEKATFDCLPFRYLTADQHPDHDTIASFRQEHLEELAELFVTALQLCCKAGLIKLGNVAIDGTELKANASYSRGKSHTKMDEEEQKLTELVNRWMQEAQRADAEEDAQFGKGNNEADLPENLASTQRRLERIQKAQKELEEEARKGLEESKHEFPPRKRGPQPKNGPAQPPLTPDEQQARNKR